MKTIPAWTTRCTAQDKQYWTSGALDAMQAEIDDLRAALASTAPESAPRSPFVLGVKPSNWVEQVAESAPADAPPVAWISEKNLDAIFAKGMAYATGFDTGGQIPLYAHRAPSQSAPCSHRIVDGRNPIITSGYLCIDCGAVFAAADHDGKRIPSQSADQVRDVSDPLISRQVSIWQAEVTRLRDLIHVATSSAAKGEAA